jgi:hypothetical protein
VIHDLLHLGSICQERIKPDLANFQRGLRLFRQGSAAESIEAGRCERIKFRQILDFVGPPKKLLEKKGRRRFRFRLPGKGETHSFREKRGRPPAPPFFPDKSRRVFALQAGAMQHHDCIGRKLRFPGRELLPDFRARIRIIEQQHIDAALRHLGQSRRARTKKARAVPIEFLAIISPLAPGGVIVLRLAGPLPIDCETSALGALLGRRLAKREKGLPVTPSHRDDQFRALTGHEIVKQRQMKSHRAAGIKLRLKSAKARKFFEHQESVKIESKELRNRRLIRSIENQTGPHV